MTLVLAHGSGFRPASAEDEERHRAFLAVVGRIQGRIDSHPSGVVRDLIEAGDGPKVVAASPRGSPVAMSAADTERILAGCRRFGPVTFSAGVADCLAIPAVLGLPCDPAHAGPKLAVPEAGSIWRLVARGTPFDGALVVWNDELRNLMTIPEDAEWIAAEGLAPHDVAAINAAVHDFFEVAFSEELVVRFGR